MSEYVWSLSDVRSFKNNFMIDGLIYKIETEIELNNPIMIPLTNNGYVNMFGYSAMPIIQRFEDGDVREKYSLPQGLFIIMNNVLGYAKYDRYWIQFYVADNEHIGKQLGLVNDTL